METTLARVIDSWRRRPSTVWVFMAGTILILMVIYLSVMSWHYSTRQPDMDEAVHIREGQEFAFAYAHFDLARLGELVSRPQWYPPGHGMLLGLWFLLWGSSIAAARLYSTFCFLVLGGALWVCSKRMSAFTGSRLAIFPVLLLVSDAGHIAGGAIGMLEVPAAAWSVITLLAAQVAFVESGQRRTKLHVAAGVAALVTFLTRYSYGIPLVAALGVTYLVHLIRSSKNKDSLKRAALDCSAFGAPVAIPIGLWLFGLGQLRWLLAYSSAQPANVERWSLDNLVVYPQFLFQSGPYHGLAVALFAGGFAWAAVSRRGRFEDLPFLLYFFFAFVALFFVKQKVSRFGIVLEAPVWIMAVAYADRLLAQVVPTPQLPTGTVSSLLPITAVAAVGVFTFYATGGIFPRITRT